jgi:glycosyltransferase involved in cell wall biosynthesis
MERDEAITDLENSRPRRIAVLHLRAAFSTKLDEGASRVVFQLAKGMNPDRVDSRACFLIKSSDLENAERQDSSFPDFVLPVKRFYNRQTLDRLLEIVDKQKIDIVHCHDYKSNFYGLKLRRRRPRLRFVTTLHGYVANTLRGRFYCWLDRRLVRQFDGIIAVSAALRGVFPPAVRSRIRVVHNGLDESRLEKSKAKMIAAKDSRAPFKVGFVGRISMEKGWGQFLAAARNRIEKDSGFRFIVAGDGPDSGSMAAHCARLGLNEHFDFRGSVANMQDLYLELDALLAPSLSEGFPLAQLEACGMGVPVVATDVGGVSELIENGETGFLLKPYDYRAMDSALQTLKNDPEFAARIARNAFAKVSSEFTLKAQAGKVESLYRQILE